MIILALAKGVGREIGTTPGPRPSLPPSSLVEVFESEEEVEMIQEVDAMGGARPSCGLPHHSRRIAHVHAIAPPPDTLPMGRRPQPALAPDQTPSPRTGPLEHRHRPGR